MKFTDRMTVDASAIRETDDGLVVQARVARGGNVQDYLGVEMGVTDRAVVRVYRPEAEVFDRKAFQTYARKPITISHPAEGVTADTWRDLAVGEIDRDVVRDGEFVSVPLLFRDAKAIAMVKAGDGPRELSMGYSAEITMRDGVTPQGEPFDAVMSDFRMNHVALVQTARGGKELRIGDGADKWGASPVTMSYQKEDDMSDALKTVVLGDEAVQVAVADAAKIDKWKAEQAIALKDAADKHAAEIATKDAAIAKAEGERDAANAKVLDAAALDRLVADRAELVGKAKAIAADVVTAGLADADIRKTVVVAKLGDAMKDKPEAYIAARFDILAEDAKPADPVAAALKDAKTVQGINQVYAERNKSLSDAWMQPVRKEA